MCFRLRSSRPPQEVNRYNKQLQDYEIKTQLANMGHPNCITINYCLNDTLHSRAIAILNKSEEIVKNTTAASNYIPRRPRISINFRPD